MLGTRYNNEIEEKWQDYWQEHQTYQFTEHEGRPYYTIDTPPPFTSGELHMGHVLSYSYFDFAARYKRMRGYNVYYPQGWDTQGFPTEVRVEKKYGRLPPAEFRQQCVEWTEKMIESMKDAMVKMGFSPDWNHQYRTMDPSYHEKVQFSLIEMYKKNMIYRGKHPVYWCPKCGSALAKTDTDDVKRDTFLNYIYFTDEKGTKYEIATTRPELMPACVAVIHHPGDERYKHLEGKQIITALGKKVPVFSDKDVLKDFGTGLLMVCTFGDKQDVIWVHRHNLPVIEIIDKYGRMKNTLDFDGLKLREAKEKILALFEENGKLVKKEKLSQVVKVHDRCKSPIELMTSMQWFANIKENAMKIKENAKKIKWIPEFGINYLNDWADSIEWDWVISRQRVFGTPIPFYYCEKCGKVEPAEKLPFYPEKAEEKSCSCGEKMTPESSTCDCWVDSSITPLIIAGWPDKKRMKNLYPAALRPQGVEIIRTWAFYTIYRSYALTGDIPFREVLLNGNVLAPDGKKMSKSIGNVISPKDLLKQYPTDAIRQWAAMSGAMAKDRPFSYEDLKYSRSFLTKVWNASRFIEMNKGEMKKGKLRKVDKWILQETNNTIKEVTDFLERYEFHHAIRKLQSFFWSDFCDDYLEYVKYRIYEGSEEEKADVRYVLFKVLENFIKLMAPITPHLSEELWSVLFEKKESINLCSWPVVEEEYEVDAGMEFVRQIIKQVRQYKAANQLPQNAQLQFLEVFMEGSLDEELQQEIKRIAKLERIELKKGEFQVNCTK